MIRAIRRAWYALAWRFRPRCRKRNAAGERCFVVPHHAGACLFESQRIGPRDAELVILAAGVRTWETAIMVDRLPIRPDGRRRVDHLRRQGLRMASVDGVTAISISIVKEGPAPLPPGARDL